MLDLARGLEAQLESARQRRDHLVGLLKTLWLQIANLEAHHRDASFDSSEISGRIRALTDDARRFLDAAQQVDSLLKRGHGTGRS